MAHLPPHPTLRNLQDYFALVCQERGWTKDSSSEKFVLFIEEVGELAKAMRKDAGLYEERAKQSSFALEEEFADVLMYLLVLANCSVWIWSKPSAPKRRSTNREFGNDEAASEEDQP